MINTGASLSCLRTKPTVFLALSQFFSRFVDFGSVLPGPAGHSETSLAKIGRLPPSMRALRDS
jgi:hypothetical protein